MCFSNNLLTNESKDIGRYCEGLSVWLVVLESVQQKIFSMQ